jgi:hypothetical protein
MAKYQRDNQQVIGWLMAAVAVWGGLLSLGALLFGYDPKSREITLSINPVRGLIVAGCVIAFLGGWALLLRSRRRDQP